MSCSVAVLNSPAFSPSKVLISSSLPSKSSITSPGTITLAHSMSLPSCSSPSSPFKLRIQKSVTGFRACEGDRSPSTSSCYSASTLALPSSSSVLPTLLKRKRPGRLDIPMTSLSFSAPLGTLAPDVRREVVEEEEEGYAICCKRGRRAAMEDRHTAAFNVEGDPKQAFFGIFDGHGGARAAEFAAENLDKNILRELTRRGDDDMENAMKRGFLETDSEFLNSDLHGGSCCLTVLIRKGNLVVSNAGDCRAVVSREGIAEALTSDHRPSREDERDRIEASGGYVDNCHGVWRIQGSLAVSRAIGDRNLKPWVTAEPETQIRRIKPHDEFLIVASDGLWDKVDNQEVIDIARPFCIGLNPEPLFVCRKLVNLSVSRGSADDVSVMLILLRRYM